ncbi:MAG: hypothetical protein ACT6FC_00190 [Methanosarcinaceae archaeon]
MVWKTAEVAEHAEKNKPLSINLFCHDPFIRNILKSVSYPMVNYMYYNVSISSLAVSNITMIVAMILQHIEIADIVFEKIRLKRQEEI